MAKNITERWFVLVNPVSGGGKGLGDFPKISHLLRENGIEHDSAFTEHRYHATELTVEAANRGYRKIIVVGGDGTLNEVVNGLFIQKQCEPKNILLAVIAVGTGNDWIRMYGIPRHYSEAIRAIKEGYTFLQDVAEFDYEESLVRQMRHMANVAGLGFDAVVNHRYQHLKAKGRSGQSIYLWSMIRSFFKHKSTGTKIWVDDRLVYNNLLFSIAIGVGKYNGGGMQQLPLAMPDDGLLDITMIRPLHWWHVIFRLRKLFNGSIYSIGHILHAQGKKIRIESSPEMPLEVDGEWLGVTPVEFRILQREVRVVVNRSFIGRLNGG